MKEKCIYITEKGRYENATWRESLMYLQTNVKWEPKGT